MPTPVPPNLLTTFSALAEVVYAGESYDSVYQSLCDSAVRLIDGCDHASLMLRRHGRTFTAAASDDVARVVDGFEQQVGEGPCIDAIDEDEPDQHFCSDLAEATRWPTLTALILEETPVRGMAGVRIRQDGTKVGALNVFSDTPGALDEGSLDQAIMLAAFASVTLAALERGEEATTLRRGLQSNREIGKAVGLLMAVHKIGDDQAFEMLSKVSQEMNIKVAEVAAQVIQHHRKDSLPSS
jgi:GAF domain-containing protein